MKNKIFLRVSAKKKNFEMFRLTFLLCLFCFYSKTNAQIPIPQTGSCVTSPVIKDFDVSKVSSKISHLNINTKITEFILKTLKVFRNMV